MLVSQMSASVMRDLDLLPLWVGAALQARSRRRHRGRTLQRVLCQCRYVRGAAAVAKHRLIKSAGGLSRGVLVRARGRPLSATPSRAMTVPVSGGTGHGQSAE